MLLRGIVLSLLMGAAAVLPAQVTFDSSIESGNGTGFTEVSPGLWEFQIEPDTNSTDRQWFYFSVAGAAGQTLTFRLTGTNTTNVTSHWSTAWPVYSTDGGDTWDHVTGPRSNTSSTFTFTHSLTANPELIAFHYPYTATRAYAKTDEWEQHEHVTRTLLGNSVQGRPIEQLRITDPAYDDEDKIGVWVIARQHAAEVTGSYTLEGFMDFVLSEDPDARTFRARVDLYVVPIVNPDGAFVGNYRDNFMGINLNRVWNDNATLVDSPEVVHIQNAVAATVAGGLDYRLWVDLHSTSGTNPHFAFHGAEGIQAPLYPTPSTYHTDSRAFLALVNAVAPNFNPTAGTSTSNDQVISVHRMRIYYGVLSFTFEGAYNRQNYGPASTDFMRIPQHTIVGEGIGRAIVSYYDLEPVDARADAWQVH